MLLRTATRFLRGFIASDAGGPANRTLPVGRTGRLAFGSSIAFSATRLDGTPWVCTLGPWFALFKRWIGGCPLLLS